MPRTLDDWLAWQQTLHPSTIDLGLERLGRVLVRLGWQQPATPVITVGGTNGKGSCVAMFESILSAAGYRVGTFTSPHLIHYRERIRIAGYEVNDASLIAAFERIDSARGDITLTFFEFNALAALLIFETAGLDVTILEVGLGGRLDVVNIVNADVAVISTVALDHCEWLGPDVASIGREKAGIFRANRPAFFGSRELPSSVEREAERIGARLSRLGVEFDFRDSGDTWAWQRGQYRMAGLPRPALFGSAQLDNASVVLAALLALEDRLPVRPGDIVAGLRNVRLAGRFQVHEYKGRELIFDVAHNPAAAQNLARNLRLRDGAARTLAVCGMFADKDVDGVIDALVDVIQGWIVVGVGGPRALAPQQFAKKLDARSASVVQVRDDVRSGCETALAMSLPGDRIVLFGSFQTVGPALEWLRSLPPMNDAVA